MAKRKKIDYLWEIYKTFSDGKGHTYKYGLDLGLSGNNDFDISQTSKNLDFRMSSYQTKNEKVYFECYFWDYEKKTDFFLGSFYFKDNGGTMSKNMMLFAYDILCEGNKITKRIFDESLNA